MLPNDSNASLFVAATAAVDNDPVIINIAAEPALVSQLYTWSRKIFVDPKNECGFDEDPLSEYGREKQYKAVSRRDDMVEIEVIPMRHRASEKKLT